MEENYAFIGLGVMGYGMASNIRQKMPPCSTLYIHDCDRLVCEIFIAEFSRFGSIKIVGSAKEAAQNSTIIISNFTTVEAVRSTYLDIKHGVINATPRPDRLLIETSTIGPSTARELSVDLAESGAGIYVDCPISGGPPAAASGTLTAMIGHKEPTELDETSQRIQFIIETISDPEKIFWCGRVGAGLAAKMSNNYIACTMMLAASEATAIAVRSGIEPEILHGIIRNSSGQTFIDDVMRSPAKAPVGFQRGIPVPVDRMVEDLSLVIDAGHETDINPRMALAALDIWKEAATDPSVLNWDGFQGR
ncbi:NAD binding domain of 6-phosphogluconate dehydrogenase-domain-containing protein [Aspergillus germanicus]